MDFDRCYIRLQTSKNGDARVVPLKPRAMEILRELGPKRSESVFGCTSESFRTAWNRAQRRSGVQNFRSHDLRHEAISELIENADQYGLSLPEVMFISGHKTVSMVTRSYHPLAPRIARKLARLAGTFPFRGNVFLAMAKLAAAVLLILHEGRSRRATAVPPTRQVSHTASIKIGDVVRLRSGGPVMTVERMPFVHDLICLEEYVPPPQVTCTWFVDDEQRFQYFHPDALALCTTE